MTNSTISGPGRGPQHIVTISLPRFGSYWSTLGATLNALKLEFPRKGPSGEPYFHTSGDVFGGAPCWRPKCLECFSANGGELFERKKHTFEKSQFDNFTVNSSFFWFFYTLLVYGPESGMIGCVSPGCHHQRVGGALHGEHASGDGRSFHIHREHQGNKGRTGR